MVTWLWWLLGIAGALVVVVVLGMGAVLYKLTEGGMRDVK